MSKIPTPDLPSANRRPRNTFEQAAAANRGEQIADTRHTRAETAPAHAVPETRTKRKAATTDILLSIEEELKQRMVNTIAGSAMHTGVKQQQMFIRLGIRELCERYEAEFNQGERFPTPPPPPQI